MLLILLVFSVLCSVANCFTILYFTSTALHVLIVHGEAANHLQLLHVTLFSLYTGVFAGSSCVSDYRKHIQ